MMKNYNNSKLISGKSFNNVGLSSVKEHSAFNKISYYSKSNNYSNTNFNNLDNSVMNTTHKLNLPLKSYTSIFHDILNDHFYILFKDPALCSDKFSNNSKAKNKHSEFPVVHNVIFGNSLPSTNFNPNPTANFNNTQKNLGKTDKNIVNSKSSVSPNSAKYIHYVKSDSSSKYKIVKKQLISSPIITKPKPLQTLNIKSQVLTRPSRNLDVLNEVTRISQISLPKKTLSRLDQHINNPISNSHTSNHSIAITDPKLFNKKQSYLYMTEPISTPEFKELIWAPGEYTKCHDKMKISTSINQPYLYLSNIANTFHDINIQIFKNGICFLGDVK
jgi:hypothetical protein